jgi:probable addiction module antidote protein
MATKRRAKETFSRWDAADYLKSEADMVAYLRACLEEAPDDPSLLAAALGDIARAHGMVQLAKETGITRDGLYKALSKDGNPSFGTVLKVMHALGLTLVPGPAASGQRRGGNQSRQKSLNRAADCAV